MNESSDSDDIEEIRRQKREELTSRATTPDEPVHVDGRDQQLVGVQDEDDLRSLVDQHS